jgi:hypothetical protein
MCEKEEAGKQTPNKFYDLLFDRYPGDNTVNNKKTREGAKIVRKKQKVWL